jgi:hypothetical protein
MSSTDDFNRNSDVLDTSDFLSRIDLDISSSNDSAASFKNFRSIYAQKEAERKAIENLTAGIKANLKFTDAVLSTVPVVGVLINPARDHDENSMMKNVIWAPNFYHSPGKNEK